ncbi:MAG: response regulator transcription factor [Chloroflexota bacterium]
MAGTKTRILVVDDHPVFRRGLISVLEGWPDFDIVGQASHITEAITMAEELQPAMVIMDIRMTDGSGVEAIAAIQEVSTGVKILILTVSDEDSDLVAAMKEGARGYILKSVELDGLVSAIRVVAAGDIIITPVMAARLMSDLRQGIRYRAEKGLGDLSNRERQVMHLVAQGASNKEIAAELSVSENTVKVHLRAILEKLHVRNRAQAAAKATGSGLLI